MTHRAAQIGSRILAGGLAAVMFVTMLYGQRQTVVKDFRAPRFYDAPYQNQIQFLLTGAEGRPLEGGKVLLKQMKLETFAKTGEPETIASSPECVFDTVDNALSSGGPMQMQTADGRFLIQGEGFMVRQTSKTNYSVVISNKVETTIRKDLLAAQSFQGKSADPAATNATVAPSAQTTSFDATSVTNQFIKVLSDHGVLSSVSNLAVYSGNVRVVDPQMDLTCENLALRRLTNGSLESVVAETNVVIIGKQDNSRAIGERAVYRVNPEAETVELTGNAQWQDGQREARAESFLFDRKGGTVRAEPNAYLKLPRAALSQSGPLSTKSVAPANAPAATNEFIEITSAVLIMQLPTANRPSRVMIAQTNVVILNAADKSRGTGDEAVYTEADGTFRLSGKAMLLSDERLVRGDTLTFDRTGQIFTAQGNAFLKLPVTALGKTNWLSSGSANSTKRSARTNQLIEVFSDSTDYRDNALNFRENVRANFLEGETLNGWLTSDLVTVQVSNDQVKSIVARGNVAAGQVPASPETGRNVYKQLNCEILTINLSANGRAESFVAEKKVVAKQDEVRAGTNAIHTTVTADALNGFFFASTNQLERMVAERNVFIEQADRSARGAKAVYTATNNLVELTGRPSAKWPGGWITEADALIWDRANERVSARGRFKGAVVLGGGTNQTNLRFPR